MTNKTKLFSSLMAGAPVLNGVKGSMIALLDAVLDNGFGVTSVVSIHVTAGIATATFSAGHPFIPNSVGTFSGATPAGLNGEKRILTVAANSVTFDATGIADGAATGVIVTKVAPLGWTKTFSGTNLASYKMTDPEGTGFSLRVDDTATAVARVLGYETMTDVGDGLGRFPAEAQMAGGMYWPKSNVDNATPRAWRILSDGQSFMLHVSPHASYQGHGVLFGFGDLLSDKSGDAYGCALFGSSQGGISDYTSLVSGCLGYGHATGAGADAYVPRSYTGLGGSQVAKKVAAHNTAPGYSGMAAYNGNALPYPNSADNSLRITPVEVLVGTAGFRGRVAGLYHSPQLLADAFNTGDLVPGTGIYAGRTLMALRTGPTGADLGGAGTVFVDINGSWRA